MSVAVKKNERLVFFVFLAAFLIRVLYILQILKFPLTEYLIRSNVFDQYGFDKAGIFIASGNWFGGNEIFGKEPLYSYFLAVIYKVFGWNHFWVYLIQAMLTSVSVALLYKVTKEIFNKIAAYIAAFIFAFYAVSIFYDALILRASFLTSINIFLFYLLVRARRGDKPILWLVSGLVLGLSILTRQNILFPFIITFVLVSIRPFKRALKCVLIFTLGLFFVLTPVLIRNYLVSGNKNLRVSKEVNAFWVGNTHTSSGVDVVWSPEYHRLEGRSGGSVKKMANIFLNEVKNRPQEYLRLYARKIWMFFNGYEAPSNTNYYLYREEFPTVLRLPLFSFQFVCALFIIGIILSVIKRQKAGLAYVFIAVLSGSVMLFHIQSRFRLPAIPFFIMFASYGAYHIFETIKNRNYKNLLVITAILIFLYVILEPDLTYAGFRPKEDRVRFFDRTNLAMSYADSYANEGEPHALDLAMRQCDLSIKDNRRFATGYRVRGYIQLLKQNYAIAELDYKKAMIYNNRSPFLYNELGCVYYKWGQGAKALIFIKRALSLLPENKGFIENLSLILQADE
ncbi:MAG: glycosyltransferase family 39 protein [Candidatus Omnitrophica bacterium]|nr:glycosyltransferase family 39 protein [Candidatus Omnitrophota bacterium]